MKTLILLSMTSMLWWRNHILLMLMSLELLLLSSLLIIMNSSPNNTSFTIMLFLTLSVLLSSLGLSMLVNMSRTHHSSHTSSIIN